MKRVLPLAVIVGLITAEASAFDNPRQAGGYLHAISPDGQILWQSAPQRSAAHCHEKSADRLAKTIQSLE
jgi:hypothetical protein